MAESPEARRQNRLWQRAKLLASEVTPWLAFRWLFAQQYNEHHPQGVQKHTKQRAAVVAQSLVKGLGGALMAPPPTGATTKKPWRAFIKHAQDMDRPLQTALMVWIAKQNLGREHAKDIVAINLLMTDIQTEVRCNRAGWVIGKGYQEKKQRRKRKRHKAL